MMWCFSHNIYNETRGVQYDDDSNNNIIRPLAKHRRAFIKYMYYIVSYVHDVLAVNGRDLSSSRTATTTRKTTTTTTAAGRFLVRVYRCICTYDIYYYYSYRIRAMTTRLRSRSPRPPCRRSQIRRSRRFAAVVWFTCFRLVTKSLSARHRL